jgi:hypothetical protein
MHKGSAEDRRTVAEYCLQVRCTHYEKVQVRANSFFSTQDVWLCFKIIEIKIIFFKVWKCTSCCIFCGD